MERYEFVVKEDWMVKVKDGGGGRIVGVKEVMEVKEGRKKGRKEGRKEGGKVQICGEG